MESSSLEEFADFGEGALLNTVTGGVTGGIDAYSMAKQQNTQACNSTNNKCFVAGTLVLTDKGTVPIETIAAGDVVWAWDEKTGDGLGTRGRFSCHVMLDKKTPVF